MLALEVSVVELAVVLAAVSVERLALLSPASLLHTPVPWSCSSTPAAPVARVFPTGRSPTHSRTTESKRLHKGARATRAVRAAGSKW